NLEAKNSAHGILCAEVVHALAPEAELLLANWDADRPDQFLEAVRWARGQGARILTCSLIMPSWRDGDGGGTVHAALAVLPGRRRGTGQPARRPLLRGGAFQALAVACLSGSRAAPERTCRSLSPRGPGQRPALCDGLGKHSLSSRRTGSHRGRGRHLRRRAHG